MGEAALAGWPRVLHVAAAASDAARCTLAGEGFGVGPLTVGEPVRHARDGAGMAEICLW